MSYASEFMATVRRNRARRAKYRQTVAELSRLTNRDLADMGISRYDVERIAEEAARGI